MTGAGKTRGDETLRSVHLSGPIGLGDPGRVFRVASALFGEALPRIPDGQPESSLSPIKPDIATRAIESHRIFQGLVAAGELHSGARFQVALPSVGTLLTENPGLSKDEAVVVLQGELAKVLAEIPHEHLAISWRVVDVFFTLESGHWSEYIKGEFEEVVADLARLGDAVPIDVQLGFDLRYGNLDRSFLVEQTNAARMVAFVNGILPKMERGADWISIPVPGDRDTPDYFMPLAALRRYKQTQLYLGLLQMEDLPDEPSRRLAAASRFLPQLGLSMDFGPANMEPERVEATLTRLRSLAGL